MNGSLSMGLGTVARKIQFEEFDAVRLTQGQQAKPGAAGTFQYQPLWQSLEKPEELENMPKHSVSSRKSHSTEFHELVSEDGRFRFLVQADGNVVLYHAKGKGNLKPLWGSMTLAPEAGPFRLELQNDGNLVVYGGKAAIWSSGTPNIEPEPFSLVLHNDGNVVLYDGNDKARWQTGTRVA